METNNTQPIRTRLGTDTGTGPSRVFVKFWVFVLLVRPDMLGPDPDIIVFFVPVLEPNSTQPIRTRLGTSTGTGPRQIFVKFSLFALLVRPDT